MLIQSRQCQRSNVRSRKRAVAEVAVLVTAMLLSFIPIGIQSFAQESEAATLHAKILELERVGKFSEAIPFAQRLLRMGEEAVGPDHRAISALLNNLAALFYKQGRYTDAEPL